MLWVYRTTVKTLTGETRFSLAFGHKVVIPVEIGIEPHRTKDHNEIENREYILLDLDLLEEKREAVRGQLAIYKQNVTKFYSKSVWL